MNYMLYLNLLKILECEKIDFFLKNLFFYNYVKIFKLVIFKNVLRNWLVFSKWINGYLREKYGKNNIYIKLIFLGEYEGVELRNMWENYEKFKIL